MFRDNRGVNCCLISLSVFAELKAEFNAQTYKDRKKILRGNLLGLNRRKNHDPLGFQILYNVFGNSLQLHKTNKNQANNSLSLSLASHEALFLP